MINYILITNDEDLAAFAEECGVNRIFVDLEKLGKFERQGHLDTLISNHTVEDAWKIKKRLKKADLIVRLNPLNDNSQNEVNAAVEAGADYLMLPMFRHTSEVVRFISMVKGRTGIIPLVETYDAVQSIPEIAKLTEVSELYIGLNDLHLDMGLRFMFEPVANGMLDSLASIIRGEGKPFGFGGIARVGEGMIPGEMVLSEHIRLGSSSVILSRTFHRKSESLDGFKANTDLSVELDKLVSFEKKLLNMGIDKLNDNHEIFETMVVSVAGRKGK